MSPSRLLTRENIESNGHKNGTRLYWLLPSKLPISKDHFEDVQSFAKKDKDLTLNKAMAPDKKVCNMKKPCEKQTKR